MKNDVYWVWLQDVLGFGADAADIVEYFSSAKNVFDAGMNEIRQCGLFEQKHIEAIEIHSLKKAESIVAGCKKDGIKIIDPEDAEYPVYLRQIDSLPLVLYVWGDEKALSHKLPIGVVGTRRPSRYGMDVARTLTMGLSGGGALIVSGGALGIDSTAHTAAMDKGGKTVVVLGCGIGYRYNMECFPIRERASKNGAVISEFPPFEKPTQYSFILRNRIIAGMSRGVLVVEAGRKSGSLNTARTTIKYQRDLFVVTGDAKGTGFLGANELARKGAKIVFSADDILSLYGFEIRNRDSFSFGSFGGAVFEGIDEFPLGIKEDEVKKTVRKKQTYVSEEAPKPKKPIQVDIDSMTENQRLIYGALQSGTTRLDDIAFCTKLQIRDVLVALTELEIDGIATCGAGNEYILN